MEETTPEGNWISMRQTVALFGEAERGGLAAPIPIKSLPELNEVLGNPPKDTRGIFFAVQFLLYKHDLIYIRVKEEGFSTKDYLKGMKQLLKNEQISKLSSICLPGVGDARIIDSSLPVCEKHQCFMVTTERDLYDYLTSLQLPVI